MDNSWHLYVVECADQTLYTGITTDLERRIHEHNHSPKGARYTRCRRPVQLVASWTYPTQSQAASAEWHFKQLSRDAKLDRLDLEQPV